MSKNICILPTLRHHTCSFVQKLKKNPICQFCQFIIVSTKFLLLKKSDSQNPRKWLSCVIKLEILDFQAQTNRKKVLQTILKLCKNGRKNNEN